jgi:hypothetical protein
MNKYIGHESQIYGVEEHRIIGGKGDGMRLLLDHSRPTAGLVTPWLAGTTRWLTAPRALRGSPRFAGGALLESEE